MNKEGIRGIRALTLLALGMGLMAFSLEGPERIQALLTNGTSTNGLGSPLAAIISGQQTQNLSIITPPGTIQPTKEAFPPFLYAVWPFSHVPNWGLAFDRNKGTTPASLPSEVQVGMPSYDMKLMTIPLRKLIEKWDPKNIPIITMKYYYSTRFLGRYDLDSGEYEGTHPGIDFKVNLGAPVRAVAGGRVQFTRKSHMGYGNVINVEMRPPDGRTYFAIYAHLDRIFVKEGDSVVPGQVIGTVGMSGRTTSPHLHLQIDRKLPGETGDHKSFWPPHKLTPKEAEPYLVNPIIFVKQFGRPSWM